MENHLMGNKCLNTENILKVLLNHIQEKPISLITHLQEY